MTDELEKLQRKHGRSIPASIECQSAIDKDLVRTYYGDIGAFYRVRAALATTPAVVGEPVAYRWKYSEAPAMPWICQNVHPGTAMIGLLIEPLYATPPASPLRGITDEMVNMACEVYAEVYHDDDKDMGDAMRAALKSAFSSASPPEQPAAVQDTYFTEDRFLGRCQHCLDNAYFRDEAQLCERDPECLIRREREARATAPPFQPHENCNCLMCLAEKSR